MGIWRAWVSGTKPCPLLRLSAAGAALAAAARPSVAPGGSLMYTVPLTGLTFSAVYRTGGGGGVCGPVVVPPSDSDRLSA